MMDILARQHGYHKWIQFYKFVGKAVILKVAHKF